jgi:hypothetical protein
MIHVPKYIYHGLSPGTTMNFLIMEYFEESLIEHLNSNPNHDFGQICIEMIESL